MSSNIRKVCLLFILLLPFRFVAAKPADNKLKLISWNWPPYIQAESGRELSGPALDRVRCTLSKMNQPYQLVFSDKGNAHRQFQKDRQHGIFPIATSLASRADGEISDSILTQHWMLYSFQNTGREFFSTRDYKENFNIGATFGSNEWFWLKKNGYRVTRQPGDSSRLVELLLERKVEAILLPAELMNEEFEQRNLSPDSFSSIELHSQSLGIFFSKSFLGENPDFINKFNRALKSCMPPVEEEK